MQGGVNNLVTNVRELININVDDLRKNMYIYAIGTATDRQKIGYSACPSKRLKTLQTGNPEQLFLHFQFEIDECIAEKYERYIHKEYQYKRLKGEWFSMTPTEVTSLLQYQEIVMDSSRHLFE